MGRFLGYLGKRVLSYVAMVFIATSLTYFKTLVCWPRSGQL